MDEMTRVADAATRLSTIASAFTSGRLGEIFPLTLDFARPYSSVSLMLMFLIAGLAVYGYYASRGDEPLFGRALLD